MFCQTFEMCPSLQYPHFDLNLCSTVYSYNKLDFRFLFLNHLLYFAAVVMSEIPDLRDCLWQCSEAFA